MPEEEARHVVCHPAVKRQVVNRLHRASGQLDSIIAMVEGDGDCRAVITQLSAVSAALKRTGYVIVANHMKHSLGTCDNLDDDEHQTSMISVEELEKLFMILS